MNFFDSEIITCVNRFSQHSWLFDKIIVSLVGNHLLKGGVLAIIIWWAWFKEEDHHVHNRKHIISTLFSCVIALALGRALALTLPFRLRPLHQEGLHFLLPYGADPTMLETWSSFPSDHAVLFFTLSTGLLFISRQAGTFALFYTILFICLPRVYLGLHYPTDIIAGAIIGMAIALIGNIYLARNKKIQTIENWSYSKPYIFYPIFFLVTYQIADMFDDVRALFNGILKVIQSIVA